MPIACNVSRVSNISALERASCLSIILLPSTILKLHGFHAYPTITTTTGIIEPYATQCLASARAICNLSCRATMRGPDAPAVSPVFIWTCWIAARIMFGMVIAYRQRGFGANPRSNSARLLECSDKHGARVQYPHFVSPYDGSGLAVGR